MTMTTRSGSLMEALGGVSDFSAQARADSNEYFTADRSGRVGLGEAAADFATADEMVDYINAGIPKSLHDKANVYVRKEKGLGQNGLISVKFVSNDYKDNPRFNNIEHNAFYRIIFMLHQQPETPDPTSKLKFEVVTGADRSNKSRGLNNPRFMPQKTFRAAADKVIDWFKKNEKVLLDWPQDWSKSEALKGSGGREVVGTAEIKQRDRLLMQVPIYKGDSDADLRLRAQDHARMTDPSLINPLRGRVEVVRHALGESVRGKVQQLIMQAVEQAGAGNKVSVNSLARRREFLGIDYGRIQKGYETLAKAGHLSIEVETGVDTYLTLVEAALGERMVDSKKVDRDTLQSDVAYSLNAMEAAGFKVKYDVKDGTGELTYKGLVVRFSASGENLYLNLPEVYFKSASREAVAVLKDLLDEVDNFGGALNEGRIGRFYLTSPSLSRKPFTMEMARLTFAVKNAAVSPGKGESELRDALVKADKALMMLLKAEREAMVDRLSPAEANEYRDELDLIEARLQDLRVGRTDARKGMLALIRDVMALYGL